MVLMIAAGGEIFIGLGNVIPADFCKKIHVGKHSDNVEGRGNAVVTAVIGGVGEHDFGDRISIGGIEAVEELNFAGIDKVAKESAGPGKEDVGEVF